MIPRDWTGQRVFYIGIKGTGMIGCATLAHESGAIVLGSDTSEVFVTDHMLAEQGIKATDFSPDNITKDIALVVYSIVYPENHPQRQRARELGIPEISYTEHAASFFNEREGLAVIGSHGKTTTSAMLAHTLMMLNEDPTALIGGEVIEWKRTARLGKGKYMVMEGDEYHAKFLSMRPRAVIVTNIEYDHPDYFKTPEEYRALFCTYLEGLPEDVKLILSDEAVRELGSAFIPKAKAIVYRHENISMRSLGEHNQKNASGVLALLLELGFAHEVIHAGLVSFDGTKRRLERYSKTDADVHVFDDFAHHPSEIVATLAALKHAYPNLSITAIFQPHTYSRTEALLNDFSGAFTDADEVYILPMYGSARENKGAVGSKELASAIAMKHANAHLVTDREALVDTILKNKSPRVVVCLGAGDGWEVAKRLVTSDE